MYCQDIPKGQSELFHSKVILNVILQGTHQRSRCCMTHNFSHLFPGTLGLFKFWKFGWYCNAMH